jgi:ABC-type molybdate transport system ATPase subunit
MCIGCCVVRQEVSAAHEEAAVYRVQLEASHPAHEVEQMAAKAAQAAQAAAEAVGAEQAARVLIEAKDRAIAEGEW